jgi:hypothetical protein
MEKGRNSRKDGKNDVLLPIKLDSILAIDKRLVSPPIAGSPCPHCGSGVLDYDGLLNLTCTSCRYSLAGCFS